MNHGSYERVNRWKEMEGSEPVSFDKFQNFTMDIIDTCISHAVTELQQSLNVMCIFNYDSNANRPLLKRKNEGLLRKALKERNREKRCSSPALKSIGVCGHHRSLSQPPFGF